MGARFKSGGRTLLIIFEIILIVAFVGGLGYLFFTKAMPLFPLPASQAEDAQDPEPKGDLKKLIEKSQKSVVQIESGEQVALGSGFLYNDEGDVVTNAHVVKESPDVLVRTSNHIVFPGTVIGMGDTVDVAVVRVPDLAGAPYLKVAETRRAEPGDEIVVMGSPLGLQNTVTTGIISGHERSFSTGGYDYSNVYQISAPVSWGNSGGPLIDQNTGEVLGINSARIAFEESIGFSIPIPDVIGQLKDWSRQPREYTAHEADFYGTFEDNVALTPDAGERIVDLFYERVANQDYMGAYALLGERWRSNQSYENFRSGYASTLDVWISDMTSLLSPDLEEVIVTVIIEAYDLRDDSSVEHAVFEAVYTVGMEYGEMKILSGTAVRLQ